jgi:hypothetical protein
MMKVWCNCLLAGVLLLAIGCGATDKSSDLLGQWKTIYVDHGGTLLYGPTFKGTMYTFRPNGTVFAESHKGDTLTSMYKLNGDTLTYIAIGTLAEEVYHVDTLQPFKLVISAQIDGIPTKIKMAKRKK